MPATGEYISTDPVTAEKQIQLLYSFIYKANGTPQRYASDTAETIRGLKLASQMFTALQADASAIASIKTLLGVDMPPVGGYISTNPAIAEGQTNALYGFIYDSLGNLQKNADKPALTMQGLKEMSSLLTDVRKDSAAMSALTKLVSSAEMLPAVGVLNDKQNGLLSTFVFKADGSLWAPFSSFSTASIITSIKDAASLDAKFESTTYRTKFAIYSGITLSGVAASDCKTNLTYRGLLFDTVSGGNFIQADYLAILGKKEQLHYVVSWDTPSDWFVPTPDDLLIIQKREEFYRMYGWSPEAQELYNTGYMSTLTNIMNTTTTPYFSNMLKFDADLHKAYELDAALQSYKAEFFSWCGIDLNNPIAGDPVENPAYRDKLFTIVTTWTPGSGLPYNETDFLAWLDTTYGPAPLIATSASLMAEPQPAASVPLAESQQAAVATTTTTSEILAAPAVAPEVLPTPVAPSMNNSGLADRLALEGSLTSGTDAGATYTYSPTIIDKKDTLSLLQHSTLAIPTASENADFQQKFVTKSIMSMPESVGEYLKAFFMQDLTKYEKAPTIDDGRETRFSPEFETLIEKYQQEAQKSQGR